MNVFSSEVAGLSADRRELLERMLRQAGLQSVSGIKSRSQEASASLSFGQEQLWFLNQFDPGNPSYNIAGAVRLEGALDAVALEQALGAIVSRHETLRTTFPERDGQPIPVVAQAPAVALPLVDLRQLPATERLTRAHELAVLEARKPFDLDHGPLWRGCLLRLGGEEHVLVLSIHHIIADGWSMRVLVRELAETYDAFAAGQDSLAADLPVQYADHAAWQRQLLQGDVRERLLTYWKEKLHGSPAALDLPTDHPRPAVQSFRGARHSFSLAGSLGKAVRAVAAQEGCTPFMVLLAAFQAVLHRYTGASDLCVGSPIAGRNRAETESLIGFFVNTLVLRANLSGDPTFRQLLERTRETCLGAYAHQDLPFEMLVQELRPARDLGYTPLFQVLFSFDLDAGAREELPGLTLSFSEIDAGTAKFDLSLYVRESAGELGGFLEYNVDLFRPETAARMVGHWQTLLTAAVANPSLRVAELPLLTETERQRLLIEWNDTAAPLPAEECLHQLVESQVERTPDAVALIAGTETLTFREMNRRANRLAHHLRQLGVGPDALVGVCLDRSPEMVVALLGVLKAGGAYLPLDPNHPPDRVAFIVDDARVRVIVTQQRLAERFPPTTRMVCVDADADVTARAAESNPEATAGRNHLAYVLYTSGSTGRPKGVAIEHRSVVAFIAWVKSTFGPEQLAGVLASTSIGFDISVLELYGPLSSGGCMILAENALALPSLPAASAVTLVNTVPSAMAELVQLDAVPASVRTISLGGEALPQPLAQRIYQLETVQRLYNLYGPTETTVYSTGALIPPGAPTPPTIGRPIANTCVYILDAHRQPMPEGVPGELYIGGAGLARGYLFREELTAEKFVPNPFGQPGERLYRTGDLVRWLPNGEVEYLGRLDHQVKIRGFRIEPGEIEAVLVQHPAVRQAVVVAREEAPGDKRLVAYVAGDFAASTVARELQRHLKEQLPEYMVPSAFVLLDALPLTPNGKIDRKALPAPQRSDTQEHEAGPLRTPTEEIVAGVWAEVLHLPHVGAHANFFELGGHSLLATRVVSQLRNLFHVDLPVRALFESPTVGALAERIEADRAGGRDHAAEPIRPALPEETLSLSFAQQRMWFLDQWQTDSALYNIPAAVCLSGPLDVAALEQSLQEIVRRHHVLRTTFPALHGQPTQSIAPTLSLRVPLVDLSTLPDDKRSDEVQRLSAEAAQRPFDLAHGPLLRVTVLRLGSSEHVVLVVMHHIISDGWSLGVFLGEMTELYATVAVGQGSTFPELSIQYADYAAWQRRWLQGPILERQLSYWRDRLQDAPASLDLPTDHPRLAVPTYRGATLEFALPTALAEAVRVLGRQHGCTPFMVLLAAFQTLLHRWSGQADLCVGTPIAGRNRSETEGLIGFFVNTLVLRGDLSGDPSFAELLGRVRETCLGAYAHQDVPFERLVEELRPERDLSRSPFFQVLLALENEPARRISLPGLTLGTRRIDTGTSKFDLSLHLTETEGTFAGYLEYSTDLFEEGTAARLVGHFRILLQAASAEPRQRLSQLPLLSDDERRQLQQWNQTDVVYPQEHILHRLIEQQARLSPDAVAVSCLGRSLTFRQLDHRANALAHRLRSLGVGPDVIVGVCMERSVELVVSLLGVLKAGGAYAPLEPDYPRDRLAFMLQDAHPPVVLVQSRLLERLPEHDAQVIRLDDDWGADEPEHQGPPDAAMTPEHLAYVIYTSGSTGRPKGVLNRHRGVCNRLLWMQQQYRLTPADVVLQKTPFSFDVSVWEFFWPLLCGVRLVLARPGGHKDPSYLADLIQAEQVSVCHFVPSMLQAFLHEPGLEQRCRSLRDVMCSGEALAYELQERFFTRLDANLHNLYGPTEAAVDVTCWACRRNDERKVVPIGRPVANTQMHVLDSKLQALPAGVPGELYIGGVQVARGYLNREELTAEKFLEGPAGMGRLYRTGDLGRWLSDGAIEYLGRLDHQVKLRGFRIELGEIESVLLECAGVREAVVTAREDDSGDKRLVAYLAPEADATIVLEGVRTHLKEKLPEYMTPSAFVVLEAMPLSPNGKVDRKALPAPEAFATKTEVTFVAPRTPTEEAVAAVWTEVLGVARISAYDNFFDLGGHSLLATRVVSRLRDIFQIEAPLRMLFENPMLSTLARDVERRRLTGEVVQAPPLTPAPREAEASLSFAQQRLWFLDQWEPGSPQYNVSAAVRLTGRLDASALERSLREIVRRHEVLRTTFAAVGGRPVPIVAPEPNFALPLVDLSALPHDEREAEAQRRAQQEAYTPFDLSRGPLLRATLLRLSPAEHIAVIIMHHVVSDGWSIGVLNREVATLYSAYAAGQASTLPELPIQYADYAAWQRRWLQGPILERQLSYWRERLQDASASLDLPTDHPRPAGPSYRGAALRFALPVALADAVGDLGRQHGCTPFMVLLAAFQTLLHRWSGQENLCIGTPIAGRGRPETEGLIGFFVNTLVLRGDLSGDPSFAELLGRVRETCLGAYAHQDVPFERLVEELRPQRDLGLSPLFQVMFVLQNAPQEPLELPGLKLVPRDIDSGTSKLDLTMRLTECEEGLCGELEYSTDLFEEGTAARLVGHFRTLLQAASAEPHQRLSQLPLLSDDERRQLQQWNQTDVVYPQEHILHRLIEQQARLSPDAVAVSCLGRSLTFRQLDHRANALAHRLRSLGVGPDVIVGVCMERSVELVVSLLGVLKAGGAYAPLEPDYPRDRLAFMLQDAHPPVVLVQSRLLERLPEHDAQVIRLDDDWGADEPEHQGPPDAAMTPEHLAYVIYTSGSTGRPKGVLNRHRGVCNRLLWMQQQYRLTPADVVLQKTPFSFDVSVWEFFWPLLCGVRLVLARPGGHKDPSYLADLIQAEQVSVCHFVPSMLQAFLHEPGLEQRCRSLRDVMCSGEALAYELQERFFTRLDANLHNLYGPTEAAVDVTCWACRRNDERKVVPIGRPVANTQMHVLDSKLQALPAGVPGELYIGGVQVARGYLNREELTAEKFLEGPAGMGRLYRTGDLGRWLSDGAIEYLGRLDHQVKLRGFRIELGEIESVLLECAGVREAVVTAREDDSGDKRLVAYLAPEADATIVLEGVRTHLKEKLPEYMTPSAFVVLEAMPLSPNGKVDRKALPAPEAVRPQSEDSYVAPQGPIEQTVAAIWAEVLGIERVGANDNFFDLGGHSLLATQVLSRIRQAFPVDVPLRHFFEEPTVANLARAVAQAQGEAPRSQIDRAQATTDDPILDQLAGLSDEEVDALLRQELAGEEIHS